MGNLFNPVHILFLLFPLFILAVFVGVLVLLVRSSNDARRPAMSFRESFLSVVPQPARQTATVLFCLALLIGMIYGFVGGRSQMLTDHAHGHFPAYGPYLPVLISLACLLPGALVGSLFAVWVLGLGYVYGDARRRNMPAVPWLLVALFVPNLLGFLLYFVLRKPLGRPCPQCGQAVTPEQRFCSWCGGQQYAAPYGATVAPPGATQGGVG
jgi:uncharacterized membrane protein YhaH (DUF805 family)